MSFCNRRLASWYRFLGRFLIALGGVSILLWSIRLTLFRSRQLLVYIDDILVLGTAAVLLIPDGIWFSYIGARIDRCSRVNGFPLILVMITPAVLSVFSLAFLPIEHNVVALCVVRTLNTFGLVDGQVMLAASFIACGLSFVCGNMLLLYQVARSRKQPAISR